MSDKTYDVIVIGAGPVGENAADRAVKSGLSVAIIERELVGGECSYWACNPSKVLLRSGAALRAAQNVAGAKEVVADQVDSEAVFARRNLFAHNWSDQGQVDWLAKAGIDLHRGHGRLTGPKQVSVTSEDGSQTQLSATHAVVISTGTTTQFPDVPGLRESRPWTNREATTTQTVPARLAIIGGGVVGSEMATAFESLGSKVTVISRSGLLSGAEPFVGEHLADALGKRGVTLHLSSSPTRVTRSGEEVTIELDTGETVTADEVLVATGRAAHTDDLGLETVGLSPGTWLDTDDTLLVEGTDWLYACGDVNHRALLTHQGKYQGRAAGDVIVARAHGTTVDDAPWGVHVATADHEAVPQVVFTDPEVASAGLTAAAAEKAGYDIRVVEYNLRKVAGASLHADFYTGHANMVIDEKRQVVLGMTFIGQDVAELAHSATIAIVGQVPIERLWHAVPSFPTISEVWLRLLEQYGRPTA